MRQIPVDQAALGGLVAVGVRPKMVRPDGGQGEPHQKGNADGLPVWSVEVLKRGDAEEASELLNVSVASSTRPEAEGPVTFSGLAGIPWNFNGKSGVAFVADSVAPASGGGRPGAKSGADE